ncbi:MAG: two-component system, OmpR family, sensor histidine kinase MprB [Cryptosporangiaceae bacterium]|nr:two-component system, OmpR family, sensor histidine kinase MprB [Cryptosporangiaceae bacterium]
MSQVHRLFRAVRGRWRHISLRNRLTILLAAAVALAVVLVSVAVFFVAGRQLKGQFDGKLLAQANAVARTVEIGETRGSLPRSSVPIWGQNETPLVQKVTPTGPEPLIDDQRFWLPVSDADLKLMNSGSGQHFEDIRAGGQRYRMVTVPYRFGIIQYARQPVDVDQSLTTLALLLLVVGSTGVLLAAVLGRTVARAGLAPVNRLTAAAEQVAMTQNLGEAIPVSGDDELARLGTAFNDMLAALGSSREAQRRLVEDASHELRTPLTSLRTNIELLIRADETGRAIPAADRAKLLHDLNGQAVELTSLISELVELARNDVSTEPAEHLDLADVVMAATERATVRSPGANIDAQLASAPIHGRPAELERAVLNILDNATKWTPSGKPISVRLTRPWDGTQFWAVLEVADGGPGVAEEDRSRIFERFYRAASARSMPGSGLGLAIVQQAVSSHGGVVSVGEATGGGALFTIGIPSPEPATGSPWAAPETLAAEQPPAPEPEVLQSHTSEVR